MSSPFTLTKEQYQELYQEVLLFAKIGGVVNDEEGIWKMCHEEFVNELLPAIAEGDRIQVIDGVCDSFVVFTQLHHHFMSKPSWEQPQPDCGAITAYTYRIDSTVIESAIKTKYERLVPFIMEYVIGYGEYLAQDFNFDLYKAIKEVNRSNMTKFPTLQQLFQRYDPFCIKYGQRQLWEVAAKDCEELSKGKYKNVVAIEVFNGLEYVAAFRENFGKGKIVKHLAFYEEPDFTHCLLEN